ncbi:ABC transporter ATP-binding protein [Kitasatospora terrestris]|uniref:ABC transporter ATP-binding protein n=1 Tax=Kitasatospora terrestris TaxID=258051 RepID=A0ABP9DAA1_9ACTN
MSEAPCPSAGRPSAPGAPGSAGWARRLAGYCLRHRADLARAYGAALVAAVATAVLPLVLRHVVDRVGLAGAALWAWVALLLGLGAVRFAGGYLRRYSSGRVSLGVQYDLRNDVLAALLRLGGRAQDELQTGQVVSRAVSDVTLVQMLLQFLPNMVGNALMFTVSVALMATLSLPLTLVALVVGPVLWLIAYRSRRDLFPANWHAQQEAAEVAAVVEAAVSGVRVVKGFGQEQRELAALEERARGLFSSRVRVARLTSRYHPALQAVPALGQVAVLALGGRLALHGEISLGTFVAFTSYLGSFVTPVRQVAVLLTVWQQARAGVERVLDVIDAPAGIGEPPDPVPLPAGPPALEWDGVVLGRDRTADPVLDGFTLRVEPGETVALVGAAGSGKSTAAALLPRFYDPDAGTVRIGGVDVRDLGLADLRSRIGFVFEEPHLLSGTVAANIAYGRPDAAPAEIRRAARLAQADGFVTALADGYDTLVGEQGLTLSGGQRQRIALARAILRDPDVLVLDDATSAIDARVEAAVHTGLREVARRRTTLIIAHRASTLELADRVAVLDGGRIVDIGTTAQLHRRSPLFRSLLSPDEHRDDPPTDRGRTAEGGRPRGRTAGSAAPSAERPDGETPRPAASQVPSGGTVRASAARGARPPGSDTAARTAARAAATYAQVAAAAAPGAMAHGAGMLGGAPASPELLARIAALPAVDDDPDIAPEQARAADPGFGLRSLLRPFRLPLLAGLALVGADALAQIAVPVLVRHGVDDGVTRNAPGALLLIAAAAAVVVLSGWLVNIAQVRVTGRTGERLLYTLRVRTWAQLQRLGLDYYEGELGGRIMTRMTTDVDALSAFLQTGLVTFVVSLLTVLGVLLALLGIAPALATVLLVALPVLVGSAALFRARSVPAYLEARERISAVNAYLQENVALLRLTQAFGRQDHNRQDFARLARSFLDARLRAQRLMATFFPFVEFLATAATAAVLVVGAGQVRDGRLSAGTLIAFLLCVDLFFSPIQQLAQVFDGYQQAVVGLARLRTLMREPIGPPVAERPLPVGGLRGEIELDRVSFGYRGTGRDVLDRVTLRIPAGQTVALVGSTGAGKSTVVKLVARFYDPTAGTVRVDGTDLRDLDPVAYRCRLGVVPQEPHLLGATVRDAIAYGRPDATDAEVEAAARAVGAHETVVGLPSGYLTEVGERGRGLSAGQRQLLALARAELVDPDILLLDEATASLDLAAERRVAAATAALTRRRTTLVVAHRLTTAARADRVVVLDGGAVVETGTHQELLAAHGPYRRLWDAYRAAEPTAEPTAEPAAGDTTADAGPRSVPAPLPAPLAPPLPLSLPLL